MTIDGAATQVAEGALWEAEKKGSDESGDESESQKSDRSSKSARSTDKSDSERAQETETGSQASDSTDSENTKVGESMSYWQKRNKLAADRSARRRQRTHGKFEPLKGYTVVFANHSRQDPDAKKIVKRMGGRVVERIRRDDTIRFCIATKKQYSSSVSHEEKLNSRHVSWKPLEQVCLSLRQKQWRRYRKPRT